MSEDFGFQPNWVTPPGETIIDVLSEKNISVKEFSKKMGYTESYINKLLIGELSVNEDIAEKLEKILGSTISFWINRETQYNNNTVRLKYRANERKIWLKELPLRDMMAFGWINPTRKIAEKEKESLKFFGVTSINEWNKTYNDLLTYTAFRTSKTFKSKPESVITWLRQGEIISQGIECRHWNSKMLQERIMQIKSLSRLKDPGVFIPKLKDLLATCGIALSIVRVPSGCRASGATFFINPQKAMLLLSFRYLSEDHFWFSLFHEIGHLLLHGKKSFFIEGLDMIITHEEEEANNFAENILIPSEYQAELKKFDASKWRQIIRYSKKVGISPGIVVGQLQKLGLINYNQLNKLKIQYRWVDS